MRWPSERWDRVLDRAAGRRPAGHGVQSGGHGTAAPRREEDSRGGVAALDLIQRERFDLVLTDIRMPRLDGPGLYRELTRRDPELARRLIFLTGDTLSPDFQA